MQNAQEQKQPPQKVYKPVQCEQCHAQYQVRGDQKMKHATSIAWTCPNCQKEQTVFMK